MASGTQRNGTDSDSGADERASGSAEAVAAAKAAAPANGETVRVDSWIWSVRLVKTRSMGATACRGGHVRVNGERVKPAHALRVGDEVRLRHGGRERVVVVKRLIRKRVGAPAAPTHAAAADPEGLIRAMPGWEINFAGHTLVLG
ncbi:RNA-binding S4 domain-containing protein, partial [Streptomyces ureilyticus]|uniref:RNA-binding S4 domain-containing protein n=1 Tax=Streptomyces ureilyticus TaxID=1775131 RepID=UPI001F19AB85